MKQDLQKEFSSNEVKEAIDHMKGITSLGPDCLPIYFYQCYWDIVDNDIVDLVLKILNNNSKISNLNNTFIWMIPKVSNPSIHGDFLRISLCNITLKIVTKTTNNRIKPMLDNIMNPLQSSFILGRLIIDNIILTFESFHTSNINKSSEKGYMAMKLDMAKAYDRLERDFIKKPLLLWDSQPILSTP